MQCFCFVWKSTITCVIPQNSMDTAFCSTKKTIDYLDIRYYDWFGSESKFFLD